MRIPSGVVDGSLVRVAGEGGRGSGGEASGDLFLRIRLKPHPAFQVNGRDLTTRVTVPVSTAVLGGEVSVVTLGGKTVGPGMRRFGSNRSTGVSPGRLGAFGGGPAMVPR